MDILRAKLCDFDTQYFAHNLYYTNSRINHYIYASYCAMYDFSKIASAIKARRLELSLSQQDVSEMSAIALRTVNALETGQSSVNLKNISAIADVLGLELRLELKKMQPGDETDL